MPGRLRPPCDPLGVRGKAGDHTPQAAIAPTVSHISPLPRTLGLQGAKPLAKRKIKEPRRWGVGISSYAQLGAKVAFRRRLRGAIR